MTNVMGLASMPLDFGPDQLNLWGHTLTAGSIVATLLIIFAGLLAVPAVSHTNAGTTFSLMASSMAFVAMGIAQFMATRPPFIERLFGGLDRIYQFHRKIGIAVLCLILVHYFVAPDFQGLSVTSGLNLLAKTAGEWAFYGFVFLLVLSLVKVIPKTTFPDSLPVLAHHPPIHRPALRARRLPPDVHQAAL